MQFVKHIMNNLLGQQSPEEANEGLEEPAPSDEPDHGYASQQGRKNTSKAGFVPLMLSVCSVSRVLDTVSAFIIHSAMQDLSMHASLA
jgi:hypothetical protein